MKEVCIPLDIFNEADRAEFEVINPQLQRIRRYRLESVDVSADHDSGESSPDRFTKLQQYICEYNHRWELIQILDSEKSANYIHLLYREIK